MNEAIVAGTRFISFSVHLTYQCTLQYSRLWLNVLSLATSILQIVPSQTRVELFVSDGAES